MRIHPSKALIIISAIFFLIIPVLAQQAVTVSAVVEHPDQYDGKKITVIGTIGAYRERTSARGNAYTTFRLGEAGASISVFVWKHPGLHNGQRVRVVGVFARIKHVGRYEFKNEIEAMRINNI